MALELAPSFQQNPLPQKYLEMIQHLHLQNLRLAQLLETSPQNHPPQMKYLQASQKLAEEVQDLILLIRQAQKAQLWTHQLQQKYQVDSGRSESAVMFIGNLFYSPTSVATPSAESSIGVEVPEDTVTEFPTTKEGTVSAEVTASVSTVSSVSAETSETATVDSSMITKVVSIITPTSTDPSTVTETSDETVTGSSITTEGLSVIYVLKL
ncbi:unnamed protein product [Cylicostephanus goldi]|uniref:Uncharacterized protein n=1 Tax=Cylicostephanus goldi TaxID=71465 RepID=A0A3P7NM77_CYLGO|nr:unnamed protein product [Cylicostephanus goldi]